MIRRAVISQDDVYRYSLTRTWDLTLPLLGFIMLNPSTADGETDDPTIRKCVGFARRLGYGGIIVTNLFAFRATSPKSLKHKMQLHGRAAAVGPENSNYIRSMLTVVDTAVCAWGVQARNFVEPSIVLNAIPNPKALRLTADGIPWHPLMLPYSCELVDIPKD